MSKVKLGQEITVLHKLVRERKGRHYSWKVKMLDKPTKGIVVGVRVLGDGTVDTNGSFFFARTKRALLVAVNLKQTFYVFP